MSRLRSEFFKIYFIVLIVLILSSCQKLMFSTATYSTTLNTSCLKLAGVKDLDGLRVLSRCLHDGQVRMYDLTTSQVMFQFPDIETAIPLPKAGGHWCENSLDPLRSPGVNIRNTLDASEAGLTTTGSGLDLRGDKILASDCNSKIELRNSANGSLVSTLTLPSVTRISSPVFSPKGNYILFQALVNTSIQIKVLALTGQELLSVPGIWAQFLPDGNTVLMIEPDTKTFRTFALPTGDPLSEDDFSSSYPEPFLIHPWCQGTTCGVALSSSEGKRFWVQFPNNRVLLAECKESACVTKLWSEQPEKKSLIFSKTWLSITPLEFRLSAEGEQIVALSQLDDQQVHLIFFDALTGEESKRITLDTSPIEDNFGEWLVFTPDSSKFLLGGVNSIWKLRNTKTGDTMGILDNNVVCESAGINHRLLSMDIVGFSPSGQDVFMSSCTDCDCSRGSNFYQWDLFGI